MNSPLLCSPWPLPKTTTCSTFPCLDLLLPQTLFLLPHVTNLLLKILPLEGKQEPAHVVLTQLIDATGINGTAQELIHLILRIQSILSTPAEDRRYILQGA